MNNELYLSSSQGLNLQGILIILRQGALNYLKAVKTLGIGEELINNRVYKSSVHSKPNCIRASRVD